MIRIVHELSELNECDEYYKSTIKDNYQLLQWIRLVKNHPKLAQNNVIDGKNEDNWQEDCTFLRKDLHKQKKSCNFVGN